MKAFRFMFFAVVFVLLAGSARAAGAWTQLKLGMTADQALAAVGAPLQSSAGQGFEIWIYDDRAELVFYGALVGWTAPRTVDRARSFDVWSAPKNNAAHPQVLPRPIAAAKPVAVVSASLGSSLPGYRRRY